MAGRAGSLCACAGPDKKPNATETKAKTVILCKYMILPLEKVKDGHTKSGSCPQARARQWSRRGRAHRDALHGPQRKCWFQTYPGNSNRPTPKRGLISI